MQAPKGASSHVWRFYFGVDTIAAAKESIESLGGKVMMGPHEVPGGQWVSSLPTRKVLRSASLHPEKYEPR